MRVGLFTDAYLPEISGVTSAVHGLKKELERLGHEAIVYAPRYNGSLLEEDHVVFFPARPFRFHKTSRVALPYSRIATRSFNALDIVHSHTPFSLGLVAIRAAARYQLPHVHTYHTRLPDYVHYFPRWLRPPKTLVEQYSALICNRCTVVTAPSIPIREELLRYGVRRPIRVLPFGVDLSLFQQEPVWNPRRDLNIPERAPLFLYVGRLAVEKNLPFLLRVFAHVRAEQPSAFLVIVGDGPERRRLEDQCRKDGLERCVAFTGFIERAKLIDLYRAADLFIFASKTETQGLVLVEAMAGATPVVAIGAMGVLDVVRAGENGLFAPEKEDEFARIALELLYDRTRYEQLRQGALKTAAALCAQNSTRQLLAIFEECLRSAKTVGRRQKHFS